MAAGRELWIVYAGAFFSLSILQMVALATPLLAGDLGLSPAILGIVVGCRSISPMIYSIHFGAVMDTVGVRRVLLLFAGICIVVPPLYPALPQIPALIILQLVLGLAAAVVWIASQTLIARAGGGRTGPTVHFSIVAAAGSTVGPLLLGLAWQAGGAWGGYGLIALWAVPLFCSGLLLRTRADVPRRPLRWRDALPSLPAYVAAWRILARPVGAFVIACTFMRLAGVGMIESFYPVQLRAWGYGSAVIGALVATGNLVSLPASLATDWWVKVTGSARRALLASLAASTLSLGVVPWLDGIVQLAIAMCVFGFGLGVSMPLVLLVLSQGLPADQQGVAAGLRGTANRLAAFILPVLMGFAAQVAGLSASFGIVGLALLAGLLLMAYLSRNLQVGE